MLIKQIGLGKMGTGIGKNLLNHDFDVQGYDTNVEARENFVKIGGETVVSVSELIDKEKRNIVWIMLPAGNITKQMIQQCIEVMNEDDVLIDAGNSNYHDSIEHDKLCQENNIHFFDVGTSGGISGAENGACMMIGGNQTVFTEIEPLFKKLCVYDGYLYCGEAGSGHYLKMVHNGIEYGMMQSIGEGFNLLHHSPYEYNLENVANVFNNGSVIRSWLMELTENIFKLDQNLDDFTGIIPSSGEGKWMVEEALRLNQSIPVIVQSLMTRYSSEDSEKVNEKIIALLRNQFGGHQAIGASKHGK